MNNFFLNVIKQRKIGAILLAGTVILTPTFPLAGQRFQQQIVNQLLRISQEMSSRNYSPSHEPSIDRLGDNGYEHLNINLRKGRSYALVGVCDEDCGDLDFHLYDENGKLVDKDVETDSMIMNLMNLYMMTVSASSNGMSI